MELEIHEKIHSGEKPYLCELCHIPFTRPDDLKRHKSTKHKDKENLTTTGKKVKMYGGKNDYSCDLCQFTFTRPSDLNRHYSSAKHIKKSWDPSAYKDLVVENLMDEDRMEGIKEERYVNSIKEEIIELDETKDDFSLEEDVAGFCTAVLDPDEIKVEVMEKKG